MNITVDEVKKKLERGDDFVLVDVREPHEHAARNIPQAVLIPLATLPARYLELDKTKEIVVHCKAGGRSMRACGFLREAGFQNVLNMTGGMDAWR